MILRTLDSTESECERYKTGTPAQSGEQSSIMLHMKALWIVGSFDSSLHWRTILTFELPTREIVTA